VTSTDPSTILTLTNQRLCEDLDLGNFVTLIFARLDPRANSLDYARAGHCPGYVLNLAGQIKETLLSHGLPLGIDPTAEYPLGSASRLTAGDLLFLYSDGIVEAGSAGSGSQFGIERVLDVIRTHRQETPDQILDAIYRAAMNCSPSSNQDDDMTAILIKVDVDN
jgi:serine phosphatase RsbU (regulator of sigma subunit)